MAEDQNYGIQNEQHIHQCVAGFALLLGCVHSRRVAGGALDSSLVRPTVERFREERTETGPALMPGSRKAPDSHSSPSPSIVPGNAARRNTDKFVRHWGICCTREVSLQTCLKIRATESEQIRLKWGEGAADSRRQPLSWRRQTSGFSSAENLSELSRWPHAVFLKACKGSGISMARPETASGAPLSVT
jgi:hypothetical protein